MTNSRAKGSRTERELAKELNKEMGWHARRTAQTCGKFGDADIHIPELPQVLVESKAVQTLNVVAAMNRAVEDAAAAGKLPVLCHKKNRTPWLLTIRLSDLRLFMEMVDQSKSMQEEESEELLKNGTT
jgi:Holliday junction resolvase